MNDRHELIRSRMPIRLWALLLLLTLLLTACGGRDQTPTIHNVTLDPPIPLAGQSVSVVWDVSNADVVDLLPWVRDLPARQGAYTFAGGFSAPTTIMFVARNATASTQREMVVPIMTTTTPMAAVTTTPTPTSTGTVTVSPSPMPSSTPWPTSTAWPTLTFTPPPVDPIIQLWSVTPSQINAGEAVTLRWKVTQATGLTIEPFGRQPLEGQLIDQPTSNRAYNLIASNASRTVSQSILVTVATPRPQPPVIRGFTASPSTVVRGYTSSFRLSWETSGASSVWIDPGIGQVNVTGYRDLPIPANDTVYTLTARNSVGDVRAQAFVDVVDPTCTTLTPWSDLYPGPGATFGPPTLDLPQGAVLTPQYYNKMGSDGNWLYVTYVKTGAKGWTPVKSGYLSCTIDITKLPSTSVPFTVTKVTVSASPASYSGVCPVTVRSTASITVAGAGRVTFRWFRSDGTQEALQNLDFGGSGTKNVTYDWQINNIIGDYWTSLSFSAPTSFASNQANFSVTCLAPTIPPTVSPSPYPGP